jgi:hypothetical protein
MDRCLQLVARYVANLKARGVTPNTKPYRESLEKVAKAPPSLTEGKCGGGAIRKDEYLLTYKPPFFILIIKEK